MATTTTSTILACLLVEGVPILTWINTQLATLQTQIDALEADLTLVAADVMTLHNQINALQALLTALQGCCDSIQDYIGQVHAPVTLTQGQDVAQRVSLDVATQVLNVPPAIAARRQGANLGLIVPPNVWTPIGGMTTTVLDTVGTMCPAAPDGTIVIPRNGAFDLWGFVNAQAVHAPGTALLRLRVVGVNSSFTSSAAFPILAGLLCGADIESALSPRSAGDRVTIEIWTDAADGIDVFTATIAAQYTEGV